MAHSSIQVFSGAFRFWGCCWATQCFSYLHRFSIGFRSGDWLGHSRTLKCFLRSHPLLCVWGHCHAGRPSHDPSSMLLLREGGCWPKSRDTWPHPSSPQYSAVVLSPLLKSTPKSWCFHTHTSWLGWCSWDCTHPFLPPNTARGVYTKKLYFGLIRPHDLLSCLLWIIQMVFGKLQTGLDMCWLEQGALACAAGF